MENSFSPCTSTLVSSSFCSFYLFLKCRRLDFFPPFFRLAPKGPLPAAGPPACLRHPPFCLAREAGGRARVPSKTARGKKEKKGGRLIRLARRWRRRKRRRAWQKKSPSLREEEERILLFLIYRPAKKRRCMAAAASMEKRRRRSGGILNLRESGEMAWDSSKLSRWYREVYCIYDSTTRCRGDERKNSSECDKARQ